MSKILIARERRNGSVDAHVAPAVAKFIGHENDPHGVVFALIASGPHGMAVGLTHGQLRDLDKGDPVTIGFPSKGEILTIHTVEPIYVDWFPTEPSVSPFGTAWPFSRPCA
jgi:hypothetical protein